jgi:hypothetical protein
VGEEKVKIVTKRQVDRRIKKRRGRKKGYYNSAFALVRNFVY